MPKIKGLLKKFFKKKKHILKLLFFLCYILVLINYFLNKLNQGCKGIAFLLKISGRSRYIEIMTYQLIFIPRLLIKVSSGKLQSKIDRDSVDSRQTIALRLPLAFATARVKRIPVLCILVRKSLFICRKELFL